MKSDEGHRRPHQKHGIGSLSVEEIAKAAIFYSGTRRHGISLQEQQQETLPTKNERRTTRTTTRKRTSSRRIGAKDGSSSDQQNQKGSVLWTLLLVGLVFSLCNVLYIFGFIHRQAHDNLTDFGQQDRVIRKKFLGYMQRHKEERQEEHKSSSSNKEQTTFLTEENKKSKLSKVLRNKLLHEKTEIITILRTAGSLSYNDDELTDEILLELPRWTDVTNLYGYKPVIIGWENCAVFRKESDPRERFIAPTGMFNTGTNLLDELMRRNCRVAKNHQPSNTTTPQEPKQHDGRPQMSWAKRHLASLNELAALSNISYNNPSNMFPVITVRDPLWWLQSMCVHPGRVRWKHSSKHCPNLVPNEYDEVFLNISDTVPVTLQYSSTRRPYHSLLALWLDFYGWYHWSISIPRLTVRYEDLIFYTKETIGAVCACVGGEFMHEDFQFISESVSFKLGPNVAAVPEQNRSTFLDAVLRHSSKTSARSNRVQGMDKNDLEYADQILSDNYLLRIYQYHDVPLPPDSSSWLRRFLRRKFI